MPAKKSDLEPQFPYISGITEKKRILQLLGSVLLKFPVKFILIGANYVSNLGFAFHWTPVKLPE